MSKPFIAAVNVLLIFVAAAVLFAAPVQITILETSDIHGFIADWDYFQDRPYDQGLVKVATVVQQEREQDPELLLLDAGDTIQGSPLVYYYNSRKPNEPNPMAVVMNAMDYDAMTIGNHEYNFGQDVLERFIAVTDFPVMSANIRNSDGSVLYPEYHIKDVKGIKVGILALTTVGIPNWERSDHIAGLRFDDAVTTAKQMIPRMHSEGAQVIVVLAHSGTHIEPENAWEEGAWSTPVSTWVDKGYAAHDDENFVIRLADAIPEIDVILAGHAHARIPAATVNGVLIVEPHAYGRGISKVQLTVDDAGHVIGKKGEFISMRDVPADPKIQEISTPYHETALQYIRTSIGTATEVFPGGDAARIQDSPLPDLVNAVQLTMAEDAGYKADISLAAVFNNRGELRPGDITIADIYGIYPYENTLVVMDVTGDILKEALEHDATYWRQIDGQVQVRTAGDLKSGTVRDYNWDMYSGLDYTIDLSRPAGDRVTKLQFNGRPLADDKKLRLAINSYRAGGGGGYEMFTRGEIVWHSMSEIRDGLVTFISQQGELDPADYFVRNWQLAPVEVVEQLIK